MAHRSPARWMAPLALLVALAAVGYVVTSSTRDDEGTNSGGSSTGAEERSRTSTGRTSTGEGRTQRSEPRTYTVRSGDTLGTIAEETGVPVERLMELNPELDPQSLNVGDRVRLRR